MSDPRRPDPRALTLALDSARHRVGALSQEVLRHHTDLADRAAQALVMAWVDQAADTLVAVSEVLEDRLIASGRDAGRTTGPIANQPAAQARSLRDLT